MCSSCMYVLEFFFLYQIETINILESFRFGQFLLLFSALMKIIFFMIAMLIDMFMAVGFMVMLSHWKFSKIFIEEEFKFWQIQVQICLHLKQFQIRLKLRYPSMIFVFVIFRRVFLFVSLLKK